MQKGSAIIIVYLMLVLIGSLHAENECKKLEGVKNVVAKKVGKTCYYGFKEKVTWWIAEQKCRENGMHLAHFETENDQNKTCSKFYPVDKKMFDFVWTGLLKVGEEWIWYFNENTWKPAAAKGFNDGNGDRFDESTEGRCAALAICHNPADSTAVMPTEMTVRSSYLCEDKEPEPKFSHEDKKLVLPAVDDGDNCTTTSKV